MSDALRAFLAIFIQIVLSVYTFFLIMRLLLQYMRANFYNPVSRFISKTTNFIVKPWQRLRFVYHDLNVVIAILIFVIKYLEINAIVWLRYDGFPGQIGVLIWTCGSILMTLCNIGFYLLFLRMIFKWIGANFDNPFYEITYILTEPLLQPCRRFMPSIGIFDLSPLIIAILLQFIIVLLLAPLLKLGHGMALNPLLGSI